MQYDPETGNVSPFPFTPVPVVPGKELDRDIELLRALAAQGLDIEPTFAMLLFLGDEAFGLFLRRAETREGWTAFRNEFARRHPLIKARLDQARTEVDVLRDREYRSSRPFTVPEVIVGAGLLAMLPRNLQIRADVPLPGQRFRSDYEVRPAGLGPADYVRVEVTGMLDAQGRPRTEAGAQYALRQATRFAAYDKVGVPRPVVIHADELCSRKALAAAIGEVRTQLLAPSLTTDRPFMAETDKRTRPSWRNTDLKRAYGS